MKQRYIFVAAALLVLGVTGVRSAGVQTNALHTVILSNAKDLAECDGEILHCVQNDRTFQPIIVNCQDTTSILSTLHSETLQASKEARPQTLQECLEKGLNKNYSLRIIRNEEQMAANNATMENAGLLPSVSLSAGYSGSAYSNNTTSREGSVTKNRGIYDDGDRKSTRLNSSHA